MNTGSAIGQLTQLYDTTFKGLVPPIITTSTTTDFKPDMKKLTSEAVMGNGKDKLVPSLATTTIAGTAAAMSRKSMNIPKTTDKEFTKLTLEQVYNNTIKTSVAILNDISQIISEKDVITGTELRRRLVQSFLMKDRRMYVGILLVLIAFVLYFIDSAA